MVIKNLASNCGKVALSLNALGIMRTSLGGMKDVGRYNCVQDEASCVVFGTPRITTQTGAAREILLLNQICTAVPHESDQHSALFLEITAHALCVRAHRTSDLAVHQ